MHICNMMILKAAIYHNNIAITIKKMSSGVEKFRKLDKNKSRQKPAWIFALFNT